MITCITSYRGVKTQTELRRLLSKFCWDTANGCYGGHSELNDVHFL